MNEPSVKLEVVVAEATAVSSNEIVNALSSASLGVMMVFNLTVSPTLPETDSGFVATPVTGLGVGAGVTGLQQPNVMQKHASIGRHTTM